MKKIDFEVFGPGQYLYFDIGRLIQVENITGKSAGDIIRNQELARHQESPVVCHQDAGTH